MQQFEVKRGSRKCCITEQPFGPGVFFYSALLETNQGVIRNDYSCDAWKNCPWSQTNDPNEEPMQLQQATDPIPEATLIGWWKQRVPDLDSGKVYWAPDHVLVAWFDSLYSGPTSGSPQQQETTWVMALLLMQKRLLTRQDRETGGSILYLVNRSTKQEFTLCEPQIDAQRIDAIQKHLEQHLFSDVPVTE